MCQFLAIRTSSNDLGAGQNNSIFIEAEVGGLWGLDNMFGTYFCVPEPQWRRWQWHICVVIHAHQSSLEPWATQLIKVEQGWGDRGNPAETKELNSKKSMEPLGFLELFGLEWTLKIIIPLQQAESPCSRSECSELHRACPWTLPGMQYSQCPWAIYNHASPYSQ